MIQITIKLFDSEGAEKGLFNPEITLGDSIAIVVSVISLGFAFFVAMKQIKQTNAINSLQFFSAAQFKFQEQWHNFIYKTGDDEERKSILIDIYSNLEILAKAYNHNISDGPFQDDAKSYLTEVLEIVFRNEKFKEIYKASKIKHGTYCEIEKFKIEHNIATAPI